MRVSRSGLAVVIGAGASLCAAPAIAQTPAAADTATAANPDGIAEIVVTAQRRSEKLQDVPVAVTALTSEALARSGTVGTRDLTYVTPGLNIGQTSLSAQPEIRGIGAHAVGPGDESQVPTYIDGVYQGAQQAGFFEFNSVERIEVLRGPQGTLFGRNAMGGAINIVTKAPSPDFNGAAAVSYGTFNRFVGDLYLNAPIASKLYGNVSVHGYRQDGYLHDLVNGGKTGASHSIGARAKLLWEPTDPFSVTFGGSYIRTVDPTSFMGHPSGRNTAALDINPNTIIAGRHEVASSFKPFGRYSQWSSYMDARYALDGFDINLLLAYNSTKVALLSDSDVTPVNLSYIGYDQADKAFPAELRLTSTTDGPFSWIAGAFLYLNKGNYGGGGYPFQNGANPSATSTSCPTSIYGTGSAGIDRAQTPVTGCVAEAMFYQKTRSIAGYAEGTYAFTEQWKLTIGGRYTYEHRALVQFRSPNVNLGFPFTKLGDDTASFRNFSPRAVLQYRASENFQTYFTYATGFKSGLFNASTLPIVAGSSELPVVKPEKLRSLEIGVKTRPTPTTRLNISVYDYDYKKLQVSARDVVSGGTFLQNSAGGAKVRGGEIEFSWRPVQRWNVNLGSAYTHARYGKFPNAVIFPTQADGTGNLTVIGDVTGKTLVRSPDWTFNASTDYSFDAFGGDVTLAARYYHSSGFYWDSAELYKQRAYDVLGVRAGWATKDGTYTIEVFGDDLIDQARANTAQVSATAFYLVDTPGRTFGVRGGVKF